MNTQTIKAFSVALLLSSAIPAFGMFNAMRTGFSTLAGRAKTGMQSAWARPTMRYGTMAVLGGATALGAQRATVYKADEPTTNTKQVTIRIDAAGRIPNGFDSSDKDHLQRALLGKSYAFCLQEEIAGTVGGPCQELQRRIPEFSRDFRNKDGQNDSYAEDFDLRRSSLFARVDRLMVNDAKVTGLNVSKADFAKNGDFSIQATATIKPDRTNHVLFELWKMKKYKPQLEQCMKNPKGTKNLSAWECKHVFDMTGIKPNAKFDKFKLDISFDDQEKPKKAAPTYGMPFFFI